MMRVAVCLVALAASAVLVAGCGKGASSDQSASSTEASPAAPAPTPDQIKAMVAALPAPYNTGDIANGEAKFAQCRSCHTPAQGGGNLVGPNLWGVFGRKAASIPDFNYSDGL